MAHGHIIISNPTFRGYVLPDKVASFFGLPTEVPDPADETGETMIPKQWTFYTGFFESGVTWPAGNPFPVKEDENGVPHRRIDTGETETIERIVNGEPQTEVRPIYRELEDGEETDWVVPMNAQFFNLVPLVAALAQAKPIPLHLVALRASDTAKYLKDGTLPESLI
jgi:hypothetical protein